MLKFILVMIFLSMIAGFIYGTYTRKQKEKVAAEAAFRRKVEAEEREKKRIEEKEAREKAIVQRLAAADEQFNKLLSSIPAHDIVIDSENARKKKKDCEKHEAKITNVTANTNLERLSDFVAFDVETTGLHGTNDEIIQISAIRFQEWEPVEIFSTFVNPKKVIPEEASKINHITDDMVSGAPAIEAVIKDFDAFIGKSNLVAHNIPFDLKFLDYAGSEYFETKRKYYDTLELAKLLDLAVHNNKLPTLCEHFNIMDGKSAHRSDADALACGLLFKRLVELKV